ncbi:MAG: PilZ domain-containing protein [Myxococcales bacterium]|nr:PilZ domain-containing protein [Myxococcales bacterium]
MAEEQRRFPRIVLPVDFHGRDAEGTGQLFFEGADVSAGGCFLKSELLLESGEQLSLEFRVPGVPRLLRAEAKVAWVRRFPDADQPPGMGVEFLAMTDEDRAVLSRYLEPEPG